MYYFACIFRTETELHNNPSKGKYMHVPYIPVPWYYIYTVCMYACIHEIKKKIKGRSTRRWMERHAS
jgi:hypothetical protein